MIIFEKVSPENTSATVKIAADKAKELSADIILATNTGASAEVVLESAAKAGYEGKIIAITQVYGMRTPGENVLSDEKRKSLTEAGVILVTAAHTLSGVERAVSGKFGGVYPVEIMAHTLRMISQGVKVCVEISAMAMDAGAVRGASPVIALGGSGRT
jgi:hypothetical protein